MESNKTLPASWYCSKNLHELERRAVFHKSWYLLGPIVKFTEDEDVDYEFAGVSFAVRKQADGTYAVTNHADSSLLPAHQTETGLLFAALSPSAPPFDTFFPRSLTTLLAKYDFTRLPHRRSLSYTGNFNWKTMVDGYQECLHCQYTHRSFSVLYPPTSYSVRNHGAYSRHFAFAEHDPRSHDGLFLFFFPICTLNLYGGGMSAFRVCPSPDGDPGVTRMEFDYYHELPEESEGFERYFRFVRTVALEDFELCEGAQDNLRRGVYVQGVLNGGDGGKEGGVLHYQRLVRDMVVKQFKEEAETEEEEKESTSSMAPWSSPLSNETAACA